MVSTSSRESGWTGHVCVWIHTRNSKARAVGIGLHSAVNACDMHAQGMIVETDPDWVSPYGPQKDSNRRAFYSAVVTLTLGVLGRCDAA